jgi:DNA-binding PadR family transcriptional regulator
VIALPRPNKKGQTYRHTPAFILLFLAQQPCYGAALLAALQEKLPNYNTDSAIVYRSLQDLEREQAVEFFWETTSPGPAKKWYKITPVGLAKLQDFHQDILTRKANLDFFLHTFDQLFPPR